MQTIIKIAVSLCLLSVGCSTISENKQVQKGISKLTLVDVNDSAFYLNQVVFLSDERKVIPLIEWNDLIKKRVYVCDSLPNGQYIIILKSVLGRSYELPLNLINDTIIHIDSSKLPRYNIIKDLAQFSLESTKNDTLTIVYESQGCFHHNIQNTLLYKTNNGFVVEFTTDTSYSDKPGTFFVKKNLPFSFVDTLKKLEENCIKGLLQQKVLQRALDLKLSNAKNEKDSMKENLSLLVSSTTSEAIYFKQGNKVFLMHSVYLNEIPFYHNFLNALEVWPKSSVR